MKVPSIATWILLRFLASFSNFLWEVKVFFQNVNLCRNRAAEIVYGYSAAEALGQDAVGLLVDPEDFAIANDVIHRVMAGENWTGHFPVKNKMGQTFIVVATNSPFYDDGTLVGIICVSSDSRPFQELKIPLAAGSQQQ
ncbi:MAG: PAS domain-containing protein, partial [Sweet potato little leaf phytoplasma]|nr:PAS domain-containing protein [Sweet potato little leaf phytoplasma]